MGHFKEPVKDSMFKHLMHRTKNFMSDKMTIFNMQIKAVCFKKVIKLPGG